MTAPEPADSLPKVPCLARSWLFPCSQKPGWYPPLGNQDSAFGTESANIGEYCFRHLLRNELAVNVIAHSVLKEEHLKPGLRDQAVAAPLSHMATVYAVKKQFFSRAFEPPQRLHCQQAKGLYGSATYSVKPRCFPQW